ncbi:hypothetical protein [Terracoccus luteus]|uniref:Uncharacterized protein n=1 Tax=Terracoccus luteus TaxID=53356 RepID=A0A839PSM3_9MICO|nr:hypothetical protein [Terracoccus luteus]MBB2986109.1 hypothetical protein [Terracoccus luteus]MCP2172301.1 hypothetical protein [Terracoccus luteus]
MGDVDTAIALVGRLRGWTPRPYDDVTLDAVEMVTLEGDVAIELRWTRNSDAPTRQPFTLIMTVQELLNLQYGGADRVDVAFGFLTLAIEEPHDTTLAGVREVFRSLP